MLYAIVVMSFFFVFLFLFPCSVEYLSVRANKFVGLKVHEQMLLCRLGATSMSFLRHNIVSDLDWVSASFWSLSGTGDV